MKVVKIIQGNLIEISYYGNNEAEIVINHRKVLQAEWNEFSDCQSLLLNPELIAYIKELNITQKEFVDATQYKKNNPSYSSLFHSVENATAIFPTVKGLGLELLREKLYGLKAILENRLIHINREEIIPVREKFENELHSWISSKVQEADPNNIVECRAKIHYRKNYSGTTLGEATITIHFTHNGESFGGEVTVYSSNNYVDDSTFIIKDVSLGGIRVSPTATNLHHNMISQGIVGKDLLSGNQGVIAQIILNSLTSLNKLEKIHVKPVEQLKRRVSQLIRDVEFTQKAEAKLSDNPIRTKERLLRMEAMGMTEVGYAQYGIDGIFSGLYVEKVWRMEDIKFDEYLEWVQGLIDIKYKFVKQQLEWLKTNEVKVGSRVKIVKAEEIEGWGNFWNRIKQKNVGNTGTIHSISLRGIKIGFGERMMGDYPFNCLEKV